MPTANKPNWTTRRRDLREREWQLSVDLLAAADHALSRWQNAEDAPDVRDVVALLERGGELARKACGLPADATITTGAGDDDGLTARMERALAKAYPPTEVPMPKQSSPADYERALGLLLHTSNITNVPYDDILSRCRKPAIVWARFLAMDAIARELGWSCAKVGKLFRRPASDVWRARKRVARAAAASVAG